MHRPKEYALTVKPWDTVKVLDVIISNHGSSTIYARVNAKSFKVSRRPLVEYGVKRGA